MTLFVCYAGVVLKAWAISLFSDLSEQMFMGIGLLGTSKGRDLQNPYVRLDGDCLYVIFGAKGRLSSTMAQS